MGRRVEIHIDGACSGNPGPAGIGVVLANDAAGAPRHLARYLGETTNNVAEYLALVYALQEALLLGYQDVTVRSDSELLVRQTQGVYKINNPQLRLLNGLVTHLTGGFASFHIEHIPRTKNTVADRLARQAVKQRTAEIRRQPSS